MSMKNCPACGQTVPTQPGDQNRACGCGSQGGSDIDQNGEQGGQVRNVSCVGKGLGIRPFYALQRFQLGDRLELLVNPANGNVLVNARDLTVRGTCKHLSVNHTYNNRGPAVYRGTGSFGVGWFSTTGPDVGLTVQRDHVVLHGPTGYCEKFTKNHDGSFTSPPGMNADLTEEHDSNFRLAFHGSKDAWTFDADGRLLTQECRNGNCLKFHYRRDGDIESVIDSQGRTTRFTTNEQRRITNITDPTGETFGEFTYDHNGQLTSWRDRGGNRMHATYDSKGNLTELSSANGHRWRLGYDSTKRVTTVTEPLPTGVGGATWTFSYEGTTTSPTTKVTDPNGHTSTLEFDEQYRQVKATDPLGHTQSSEWTANSDVKKTTDGLDESVTYSYDDVTNNLIGTELPTGAASSIGYADGQNPHQPSDVTDPQGTQFEFAYDRRGNLTRVHNPATSIEVLNQVWNANGTLASRTDGKGATTTFDHDDKGNTVAMHPPSPMAPRHYTYDTLSRIDTVTDGNGTVLQYTYDKLDRVVQVTNITSGGHDVREHTGYDPNGNVTYTETPDARTGYTYTPRNQVRHSRRTIGDAVETISYGYDDAGNVSWLEEPCGITRYSYDAAHNCTSLDLPWGGTVWFDYDANDRRTHTATPSGYDQYVEYDPAGRQTAMEAYNAAGTRIDRSEYSYARADGADGSLLRQVTGLASLRDNGETTSFDYDGMNRLVSAGMYAYTFDAASNITSHEYMDFVINDADQFTSIYNRSTEAWIDVGWDAQGNYLSHGSFICDYSPTNQLLGGSGPEGRDADMRYATSDNTQPVHAVYYSQDNCPTVETYTHTALGITGVTRNGYRSAFVRDPQGQLVAMQRNRGETTAYFYNDYQGSTQALFNRNGDLVGSYAYAPYGSNTATIDHSVPDWYAPTYNPFRWISALQHPGTDYYLGHRHYYDNYNRFGQPDPSGQELNPYTYAQGDPINNTDPSGLGFWSNIGGFLGSAAAIAATGALCAATVGIGCAVVVGITLGGALGMAGAVAGGLAEGQRGSQLANTAAAGGITGAIPVPGAKFGQQALASFGITAATWS